MHSEDLTLAEAATDLHGRVPLAVLTGEELVVPLEGVALVAEVLDDRLLGQAAAGRRVAAVAPVLRLRGWRAHCRRTEKRNRVVRRPSTLLRCAAHSQ